MREPSWSLVPTAKCGLSSVAPCHHNTLSAPPPPRLVGLYWKAVCARATPQKSSIWLAIGAVRPSATILCTKARRESLPPFTRVIRPRSACSSMLGTPLERDCYVSEWCAVAKPRKSWLPSRRTGLRDMVNADPCCPARRLRRCSIGQYRPVTDLDQVLPHTVSSVHPSAANSEARSGASATE